MSARVGQVEDAKGRHPDAEVGREAPNVDPPRAEVAPARPRVLVWGADDANLDPLAYQLAMNGGFQAQVVRWPDLPDSDDAGPPIAHLVLGGQAGSDAEIARHLAKREARIPLVWLASSPPPEALPDAWLSSAAAPPLIALLAKLVAASPPPRRIFRRKSDMIIGSSPAIQRLLREIDRIALSSAPVLVTGETGTGKELTVRALHMSGPRSERPLVAVNCGAIPENLFESELFGYMRGAFTGAVAPRVGVIEAADHGTLFLDEIGDMPLSMQVKLLRVLERGEVVRLGSNEPRRVDVRFVAATHRDLEAAVAEKRFREDLYYRLRICRVQLPPLRERREDIPELIQHCLSAIAEREKVAMPTLVPAALDRLLGYAWPGNVRELEGVLQRAQLLAMNGVIEPTHLDVPVSEQPGITPYGEAKREFDHQYYARLLQLAGGNVSHVARLAGKTRKEVYDAMQRVGLTVEQFRS